MSEVTSKYARFVDLLLEKTKNQKIPWAYDGGSNTVYVWSGITVLNVSRSKDDNFEDLFTVSLVNKSGDLLECFNDTDLSNVELGFISDNYFTRLSDIYNLAMRQATGSDKALDEFIAALESDELDIPF